MPIPIQIASIVFLTWLLQTHCFAVIQSDPMELSDRQSLFVSGKDGVHTYRIPAIITAKNGDLIAACDARRKSAADLKLQRTIDIVFRRSVDNGKTWSPIEILDPVEDGGCSDPSFLLDKSSGGESR
ncbi:MAG: sialidase family protein [Planctomycetota bacterium]|nr:sialidase family protein [Planctomycetota bacterium]